MGRYVTLRYSELMDMCRIKKMDASKLQDEYSRLVEGLQEAADAEDAFMSNPSEHTRFPFRLGADDAIHRQPSPMIC